MIMKKTLLITAALTIVVVSVPLLAAFEAHVINVTAHIENALRVSPLTGELDFGIVSPQEYLEKSIWITTSDSFCELDQRRVTSIDYKIVQKPKCRRNVDANPELPLYEKVNYWDDQCPENYTALPLLCGYLSKTPAYDDPQPFDDHGVLAFHDPTDPANVATGTINKDDDKTDEWIIDLAVPCFEGQCDDGFDEWVRSINPDADPATFILDPALESHTFGCDLWIEVTDIYHPDDRVLNNHIN